MENFPQDSQVFVRTLLRICELKGDTGAISIIEHAEIGFNFESHDNWDGGIDYYELSLRVPIELFIKHESDIKEIEERIKESSAIILKGTPYHYISTVTIHAASLQSYSSAIAVSPDVKLPAFWIPEAFRLFVSHTSPYKAEIGELQNALLFLGVSAFVAHVDIEPGKDWENEIARALHTMDALLAFLTPDFQSSRWCDQEVGIAYGQGKLVIPVRAGVDPYGFMARMQAISSPPDKVFLFAEDIVHFLLKQDSTSVAMTNALVKAFANAVSFANAKNIIAILEHLRKLSPDHATQMSQAVRSNGQIYNSWGVPERIQALLIKHGFKELAA